MTVDPIWTSHAHICKSGAVVLSFFSPFLTLEVSSYLLAQAFLSKCLSFLADELSPANCLSYLSLAQEICCVELKMTVLTYLGRNLLEMPQLIKYAMMYNISSVECFCDLLQVLSLFLSCHQTRLIPQVSER